jgi:hypothetical protein
LRSGLQAAGALSRSRDELDATRLAPRVDPEAYRRNLAGIVSDAQAMHVLVLFLILRDNPIHADPVRRGAELLRRKQFDAAIEELQWAVRGAPTFADLARNYLAQALEAKGKPQRPPRLGASTAFATRSAAGG